MSIRSGSPSSRARGLVILLGIAFCFLVQCHLSSAWSTDAHKVVGDVADRLITETTRARIQDIIGGGALLSDITPLLRAYEQTPTDEKWSAKNVAIFLPDDAGEVNLKRDCPQRCTISAIRTYEDILRSNKHVDEFQALSFLVHFVADLHQPLHVGYARNGGGEKLSVYFLGQRKPTTLHQVWDVELVDYHLKQEASAGIWKVLSDYILSSTSTEEVRGYAAILDPKIWADESFLLSRLVAYDIPESGQLDRDYVARCSRIATKRLAMAGVRLAALLNDIFDPPAREVSAREDL